MTAYVTSLICYLSVLKNVNNNLLIHFKPSEVLARNPKCTCTMYVLFIWKPENNIIKVISRWHICFIGFGDSTGFPSEDGCVADSYFLYKWVRKRSAQVPVIIWGHSLGTGLVEYHSSRHSHLFIGLSWLYHLFLLVFTPITWQKYHKFLDSK